MVEMKEKRNKGKRVETRTTKNENSKKREKKLTDRRNKTTGD